MSILGDKRLVPKKVQTYNIYIDTTTDHITPCCACARGVIKVHGHLQGIIMAVICYIHVLLKHSSSLQLRCVKTYYRRYLLTFYVAIFCYRSITETILLTFKSKRLGYLQGCLLSLITGMLKVIFESNVIIITGLEYCISITDVQKDEVPSFHSV